ncbi:hypothetical protein CFC21_015967 [Triticum aestivum]|uniref:Peptidase A1 domain-containing protein n=2 Tax=Triticum aestivum TaxID=4565 RepID=A0A3B6AVH1_WHEAT|nr:hypothetical protein CFC21_015967 [Triticum aestivum]
MIIHTLDSMGPLQALSCMLLLASLASSAAPPPSGYRSTLTHIDSKLGFTKAQLMRRAVHRSRLRAASMLPGYSTTLSSSNAGPRLRSGQAEYLMELAIGTPPVPFVALADTGSDLTWTQCQPCLCFSQDTPVYDPTTSSSFSPVPCSSATCLSIWSRNCTPTVLCRYRHGYEDGAYSAGGLGTETITFGSSALGEAPAASAGGVAFGCGTDNGGDSYSSTGTVGLGRRSLSLVAQLGVGKFSYCLTNFFNTSLGSPFLFGSLAELAASGGAAVQSTPLVQNPQGRSWYYVSLEGISLGDALLPIPNQTFALNADGTGGMIVDSGTIFTLLVESAFRVVANHVAELLSQPAINATSLDNPCFPAPAGERQLPAMPDMVLHFAGGADMTLHRDNYMSFDKEDSSFCLNIAGTTWTSILGNFQQQNIQMLFDITVGQMSFVPTDCSKL